jgi:DNA-damage-inducible protein D
MENSNLIPFGGKEIRKIIHNDEWYFSVIDVIEILTDSAIPRNYWSDLKR